MRKKNTIDLTKPKISNYSKKKNNAQHSQKAKLGITIIQKHIEKMSYFSNKDKTIKEYNKDIDIKNKEIIQLQLDIAIYQANNSKTNIVNANQKIIDITNNIKDIESIKHDFASGVLENKYMLDVFTIINEYTELETNEENILKENVENTENNLFKINLKKKSLTDEYYKIVDPYYSSTILLFDITVNCQNCHSKDPLSMDNGNALCYNCGSCYTTVHNATDLSYKEAQEIDYRAQFTYEKRTHLQDWLRRFQAKEQKEIPQEILDKVILEARKERILNLNDLVESKVKSYLKKLNLNEYYDNVISIINRINKRQRFTLTVEVEDKIMEMFQQIQEPFERYKDPKRKNMLSYSFLLNKFFLILGLPEFSKYFILLKSPEKLRQQDETFKKIVDHMAKIDPKTSWKFHPSL